MLKVPNYRQDVILLARGPTGISVLTWSGSIKGFTVSQQPPCFLFDSAKNNYNRNFTVYEIFKITLLMLLPIVFRVHH